jgi:hypothetical protein
MIVACIAVISGVSSCNYKQHDVSCANAANAHVQMLSSSKNKPNPQPQHLLLNIIAITVTQEGVDVLWRIGNNCEHPIFVKQRELLALSMDLDFVENSEWKPLREFGSDTLLGAWEPEPADEVIEPGKTVEVLVGVTLTQSVRNALLKMDTLHFRTSEIARVRFSSTSAENDFQWMRVDGMWIVQRLVAKDVGAIRAP